MFLKMLSIRNPDFLRAAFHLHQSGAVEPNSYLIDMDMIRQNADKIYKSAKDLDLHVFAMTKQLGRNPLVCRAIQEAGIDRFVAVDPWESRKLSEHGFKLGNVGHLVQIPRGMMGEILEKEPEFVTVYSYENAFIVNETAERIHKKQALLLRIQNDNVVYPGQEGGIPLAGLEEAVSRIKQLPHVCIGGVTAFPCVLFNNNLGKYGLTEAACHVQKARDILKNAGVRDVAVNLPSANACGSMAMVKTAGGSYIEPGHAFSGTTPAHACLEQPEIPAILYLTEVSHRDGNFTYVYGGGNYSRGNVRSAMAGKTEEAFLNSSYEISFPPDNNIDYYGKISGGETLSPGDTVAAAFRTQIFVTRAKVVPVSGVHSGSPRIEGVFDALGNQIS